MIKKGSTVKVHYTGKLDTNLKFSTNVSVPFLIYAVIASRDFQHKRLIEALKEKLKKEKGWK